MINSIEIKKYNNPFDICVTNNKLCLILKKIKCPFGNSGFQHIPMEKGKSSGFGQSIGNAVLFFLENPVESVGKNI
jgi:hypothetical protein